jgi:hypothetical protein
MSAAPKSCVVFVRTGLELRLRLPVLPRSVEAVPTPLVLGKSLVTRRSTRSQRLNRNPLAFPTVPLEAVLRLPLPNLHDPRLDAPRHLKAAPHLQLHLWPISEFQALLLLALLLTAVHTDAMTMCSLTMFQRAEAAARTGNTALPALQLAMEV